MQTATKRKEPKKAGYWGLALGPLGYLYMGWRFAAAGTAVFGALAAVAMLILDPPLWLLLANLPVLGLVAAQTCERLNQLAEAGQTRNVIQSRTMPVAFLAMTRGIPMVAGFSAGLMGLSTAFVQLRVGNFASALFALGLVTPVVVVASFAVGVMISFGLDRWILTKYPATPRHIFPPLIKLGE